MKSIDKNFNLNSISGILNTITKALSIPDEPLPPLPPQLILTGANLRGGLSPKTIASRIIARQSNAGLPVGDVFADGQNTTEALLTIQIEEIIYALLNESVVNVVIPAGVGVTTTGIGNLGIPVVSQGNTTTLGIGNGIIR